MKVIAYVNANSGPSYHRIIAPLMLMPDVKVYITNALKEEDFDEGCDVFIYNRILPDHANEKIAELKKKYGFATVVDLDDHWQLDSEHVLNEYYQEIDFAKQQIEHITNADAVLCTHSRLADEIKVYNTNVHVCPNAIKNQGQFDIQHKSSPLIRLFWQGSDTHYHDIRLLEAPINGLAGLSHKIKMVMAGYANDNKPWNDMALIYTAQLKHQYKLIPYANITNYYEAYEHADICLVPLVNSHFNRMKSNLKVLEAANAGIPVIASKVHPYLDMPIMYCSNSHDWIGHITKLVRSSENRKDAAWALQMFCESNYNFDKINLHRKHILEYTAKKIHAV